ncbi:uncharacterized protein LOC120639854 [Panicum virgatum]|uniref:uncharacterized protein LOC120639854 n=1 Tax=Panicum virgatum TaxID=38727 RepID=UPI0019D5E060|nr:uncharacterized protein LOC120639854 [Panicum virgatum]
MDPNSKHLLDEMKKLGDRFSLVESHVDSLEGSLDDRFKLVEQSTNNLVAWQLGVDVTVADLTSKLGAVDDIKSQLNTLSKQLDRVVLDRQATGPSIFPTPVAAAAFPPAGNLAVGPDGHRIDSTNWEFGYGSVTTISHLPVKGFFPSRLMISFSSSGAILPVEVQTLIDQFASLFDEPSSLPPSRACDHEIPLIPGARPVNISPYRYPPALRDEIEKQVAEMLDKGLIQPSASLFSSPVLLVKKKDGSYRFCVDFRHLNALTIKSKFPVPIFDQLIDELANASWWHSPSLSVFSNAMLLRVLIQCFKD